jgi:hypothetical protein
MSERPVLTVVRGEPTPEELAAVVVVLAARTGQAGPAAAARPPSQWAAKDRQMRPQLTAGHGAWRASALPR